MESNKKTITIAVVIIIVFVCAALALGVAAWTTFGDKDKDSSDKEPSKGNETVIDKDNNDKTNNDKDNDKTDKDDNSIIDDNSDEANQETSTNNSNKPEITGVKTSTKLTPVTIGEWTVASKYVSGNYVDVPVRVTKVTRGASAEQIVKDYCNSKGSIYKYSEPKDGMEWAVVDYQLDLTKINQNSTMYVNSDITGTGDNTSINYNGFIYVLSTMNMSNEYGKGKVVDCRFATNLPIGCTEYLIELGSYSYTLAYIKGE